MRIPYRFPYPTPPELAGEVASVLESRVHYLGPHTGDLEAWNARRGENAAQYTQRLTTAAAPVRPLAARTYAHHTYLHYVVRAPNRDALQRHLAAAGIDARVHYEWPAHLHRGFAGRLPYRAGDFPVAESICRECWSLPAHPAVGEAEIAEIVDVVRTFYR